MPESNSSPSFLEKLRQLYHTPQISEDSILFRSLSLLTATIAIVAALHQMEWPGYGFIALGVALIGNVFSYYSRKRRNWILKVLISIYMLWVLYEFFLELGYETDTRLPLAKLLIMLYVGHSFDIPRRKDLNYSLTVALILIAIGAVMTTSMTYGLYLAAFAVSAIATSYCSFRSERRQEDETVIVHYNRQAHSVTQALRGTIVRTVSLILVLTAICFAAMPRFQSLRLQSYPSSWTKNFHFPTTSKGEIINPQNTSTGSGASIDGVVALDDLTSFNASINLDQRVMLSQEKVMLMRSNKWCYLRGLAFADYDGHNWKVNNELQEYNSTEPPIYIPTPFPSDYRQRTTQIIQMERDMPNLVFAAYQANYLFLPTLNVYMDKAQNLRVPFLLEKGTVYSISSQNPTHCEQARHFFRAWIRDNERDRRFLERYNRTMRRHYTKIHLDEMTAPFQQLPDCVTERTKTLALSLTKDDHNDFQRAIDLANYLRNNYTYQMVPPAYPREREVCDYFLFESKIGNCQQFATAMTVMARSLGLKARYVTGYAPEHYNPLTGYYEIRGDNAHAWVEVFLPPVGWLEFDPTPASGRDVFTLEPPQTEFNMFASIEKYLEGMLSAEQLAWIQAGRTAFLNIMDAYGRPLLVIALILLAGRGLHLSYRFLRRFLANRSRTGMWDSWAINMHRLDKLVQALLPRRALSGTTLAATQYNDILIELYRRGYKRPEYITMRSFMRSTAHQVDIPELNALNELWERQYYGDEQLNGEIERWQDLLATIKVKLSKTK